MGKPQYIVNVLETIRIFRTVDESFIFISKMVQVNNHFVRNLINLNF